MKVKILVICFASLFMGVNTNASIIIDDPITNNGDNNDKGGRTVAPLCNVTSNEDMLFINILHYYGNVQVSLISSETGAVSNCNSTIGGNNPSVTLDLAGYAPGEYVLAITLQGGTSYLGRIRVV